MEYCEVCESTFSTVTMPEVVPVKRGRFVLTLSFRRFSHGSLALLVWAPGGVTHGRSMARRPVELVGCKRERRTS